MAIQHCILDEAYHGACSATTPEGRLNEALQNEEASEATLQLKHFSRSLQSSHLTQPAQVPHWSSSVDFCKCMSMMGQCHQVYPGGYAQPLLCAVAWVQWTSSSSPTGLIAVLQALCGVGEGQSYVHFMFVYKDPLGEAEYDDNISLSYKLPVLQEGEG